MPLSITTGKSFANAEKVTPGKLNQALNSATINGAGTMAEQNADNVAITGGTAVLSIADITNLKLPPEEGYATSGTIALALGSNSNALIRLSADATFTLSGIAKGQNLVLGLFNNSGSSVNVSWPAWSWCLGGAAAPTAMANSTYRVVRLHSYGTTLADVLATLD